MYKLPKTLPGFPAVGVVRLSDKACIPECELNTDWINYLKWLEEGNKPLPADED